MENMWTFILVLCEMYLLAGCQVTLTHNSTSALADTFICGTNTKFTCKIDPAPGAMSWVKDSASLTICEGAENSCVDATVDNYQFTSDVVVNKFYVTVNHVMFSNAGTFTCSNGASVDDSKTISIAAVPNDITMTLESGTGTITLQATTDCAFPMSNVSIEWYYLKELTDTPKLYTGFSPVRTENSSTCTSGDCTSGVGVSKVVSTVTFDEKESSGTSAYLQAKMVHSAAPSSSPAVVAITTNKYIIFEATPAATTSGGLEWWIILIRVLSSLLLTLFLAGIILGCFLKGLDTWYKILLLTVIGIPVALGMLLVWKCCKGKPGRESEHGKNATQMWRMNQEGPESTRTLTSWQNAEEKPSTVKDNKKLLDNMDFNDITDNGDTWNDNVDTRSSPKKDKIRSFDNKKPSKSPGKAEGVNKEKPAVVKQNQHADQADKKHLESEEKKPIRDPLLRPVGANHSRWGNHLKHLKMIVKY